MVSGLGTTPRLASAGDATSSAAAQALFDDAKSLMAARAFAAACPKLVESLRLQAAGGTLMFLALCREGEGKTATAWALFNEVLSGARRDRRPDREKVAETHIAALSPKLTKLSIVVVDGGTPTAGLAVTRDGVELAPAAWGTPVPVDPGMHVVRARAPGKAPWETSQPVETEGQTTTVTVPPLTAALLAADNPNPTLPVPAGSTSGRRIAAIGVAGAGVAVLGVGVYFGVAALAKKGDERAGCLNGGACSASDVAASDSAVHDGNAATILLGVGAAAIVTGGVLWLTARIPTPAQKDTTAAWSVVPFASARSGGVGVQGAW